MQSIMAHLWIFPIADLFFFFFFFFSVTDFFSCKLLIPLMTRYDVLCQPQTDFTIPSSLSFSPLRPFCLPLLFFQISFGIAVCLRTIKSCTTEIWKRALRAKWPTTLYRTNVSVNWNINGLYPLLSHSMHYTVSVGRAATLTALEEKAAPQFFWLGLFFFLSET